MDRFVNDPRLFFSWNVSNPLYLLSDSVYSVQVTAAVQEKPENRALKEAYASNRRGKPIL